MSEQEIAGPLRHVGRRIIAGTVFGAVIYAALAFAADWSQLRAAVVLLPPYVIPAMLVLATMNYLIRFEKWRFFIQHLGFNVSRGSGLLVFMSGLVMSVTPGKMGEVLKSYLLKRLRGLSMSATAPAVLVERLTDLIALMLLAAVGGYAIAGAGVALGVGLGIVGAAVAVLSIESTSSWLIRRLSSVRRLRSSAMKLEQSLKSARVLVKPRPLAFSSVISVPAWFCECVGFWIILVSMGYGSLGLARVTGIYALAAVVGAISMLPGGLGATELTIAGLLTASGVDRSEAVAATLIVRAATLWYAVLVGGVFLGVLRQQLRNQVLVSMSLEEERTR